ncbi:MAG: glycoside hydrolase family 13 protein, partial [Actinomycetota bacterium]|nr:glycoside hydrolase family 13 protein [Actinomycetota bacterium]
MERLDPHHDGSALYVSDQAPAPGDTVSVRLSVPRTAGVTGVHVRVAPDGEQSFVDARRVHGDAHTDWWQAELVTHNPVTHYRFLLDGGAGAAAYRWLNGTGLHLRDVPDADDFRIVTYAAPPAWSQGAVVYQVFPDRFARDASVEPEGAPGGPRTDLPDWAQPAAWDDAVRLDRHQGPRQVYGGTLDGVAEHLDHLVDLGVTVLYLTPFFPARSNHRYDAATFDEVDAVLGGDVALRRLQRAAHERGLKVMGDITTNHTGAAHEWFRSAQADPDGPYARWYVRDADTGDWVTWLGVQSLPRLDHTSMPMRAAFFDTPESVIRRWLAPGAGLDAWRVDVANMTGRYKDVDVAHDVARQARRAVDQATHGEGLLIAEHTHDHSGDARGDGWHGVMNYSGFTRPVWTWLRHPGFRPKFLGSPLRVPRLGGELVAQTMREFAAIVPWRSLVHSFTLAGSHDTTRVRTLVGEDRDQVVLAAGLLLTYPGIPMITYGDEIGMLGDFGEAGRRPMPWSAKGVDTELWDEELYAAYRALIRARRDSPALSAGGLRWVHAEDDALVFLREHPQETALVHLARGAHQPVR